MVKTLHTEKEKVGLRSTPEPVAKSSRFRVKNIRAHLPALRRKSAAWRGMISRIMVLRRILDKSLSNIDLFR
jgi:hypothetical protein